MGAEDEESYERIAHNLMFVDTSGESNKGSTHACIM